MREDKGMVGKGKGRGTSDKDRDKGKKGYKE